MTFTTPETGVDDVDDTTMFRCPFTAADPEGVHAYEYAVIVAEWDTGIDPFASNGWLRIHSNTCSYGPEDAPGVILALFDPPCPISENGHSSPSDTESPVAIPVDEKALKEHADHDLRVVLHLDGFYEGMDVEIRIILFDTPMQMSPSETAQKW